ncbi:glycosyltransferase family 4 protein [Microbulbifer guangxiensis]|uniref:glycosyltransferase family 4 protein n=1 Tax=Microbulbifer guangxiensis TaxID=2904249 RepID=UPI001F1B6E95|nr:glycosyltransferase family 4 protein [Microbulbifer guangxiensis]
MIERICHLIASREQDSLARHVAELSGWQARNTDADVAVIAHPRYRESLDPAVRFLALNTDHNRHHTNLIWRLASHLRSGGFQIAHGHGSKSAQLLAAVQKYSDARQVITRHNLRHPRDKLSSSFDARIAVSHSVVASSRLQWHVIPNGIRVSPGSAFKVETSLPTRARIMFSGRLVKLCGLDHLLRVLVAMPEVELIVEGDGPEREALTSLVQELNLTQRVQFIGEQDPAKKFLCRVDFMVVTSCTGQPPFDWIEALLHGCPVITPNTGDADRYIPGDFLLEDIHPLCLEQKLRHALSDRNSLRTHFREGFQRAAAELTVESMGQATWEIYAQVLSGAAESHADSGS